jgi:hypothetical protein
MKAETNRNAFRRARTRTSFEARGLPFLRAVWFASRHGAPFRPVAIPHACQGVCETSFRLDTGSVFRFRTAVASDRLLPPTAYPIANPRSRFSPRVPACAIHEMRSLTFHDVQARFGRIDASRWGLSPRNLTFLHVSRERNTFRSWPLTPLSPLRVSRAVLSDDLRDSRRSLGCVLPPSREGCRRRNNPRCLPSVAPAGAIQPVIDPGCSPGGFLLRVSPTNWSGLVR